MELELDLTTLKCDFCGQPWDIAWRGQPACYDCYFVEFFDAQTRHRARLDQHPPRPPHPAEAHAPSPNPEPLPVSSSLWRARTKTRAGQALKRALHKGVAFYNLNFFTRSSYGKHSHRR